MDLKNLKTQVTYRIEPKPDGGFIARSTDPNVPSIEGTTREEVQQKMRARAFDTVLASVPAGLRVAFENQLKSDGSVDGKSARSVVFRSSGPDKQVIEVTTREQIDEFAKEFSGLVEKNFPQLAESLAARGRRIKTATNEETGAIIHTSTHADSPYDIKGVQSIQSNSVPANTPITPEAGSRWPLFVLALLTIAALMYFFFFHR
jgi:hypothetical protein